VISPFSLYLSLSGSDQWAVSLPEFLDLLYAEPIKYGKLFSRNFVGKTNRQFMIFANDLAGLATKHRAYKINKLMQFLT